MTTGDHGLRDRNGLSIRKGRISPALRTAIQLIVLEGLTIAQAAERTGYRPQSLEKALMKPHVKAEKANVMRAWRESKTERAWLTVADLASGACSEDVRLKAAKVFIDADEAARQAMPERAQQVVQIIAQNVNMQGQPTSSQLPGVIESAPYQPLALPPSDSSPVRQADYAEFDDDED